MLGNFLFLIFGEKLAEGRKAGSTNRKTDCDWGGGGKKFRLCDKAAVHKMAMIAGRAVRVRKRKNSLFFDRDHLGSSMGIISGPGSFVVQFRDHLRPWDHLRTRTGPRVTESITFSYT